MDDLGVPLFFGKIRLVCLVCFGLVCFGLAWLGLFCWFVLVGLVCLFGLFVCLFVWLVGWSGLFVPTLQSQKNTSPETGESPRVGPRSHGRLRHESFDEGLKAAFVPAGPGGLVSPKTLLGRFSSWWLNQPIWKIWVKIGNLPQIGVKIKHIWVATTQFLFVANWWGFFVGNFVGEWYFVDFFQETSHNI